jgi:hypothetical protein
MIDQRPARAGFPRVLLEVLGVVFAVLIALGVDEAWESRENQEMGREADLRILDEIVANREEVLNSAEHNAALLESVQGHLGGDPDSVALDVKYSVSLLSSAAWDAAGLTGAIRFMEFDRVSRFSRLYDLQELYQEQQRGMVDVVAGVVTMSAEDLGDASSEEVALAVARRVFGPLAVAGGLETGLLAAYDSVLVDLAPGRAGRE